MVGSNCTFYCFKTTLVSYNVCYWLPTLAAIQVESKIKYQPRNKSQLPSSVTVFKLPWIPHEKNNTPLSGPWQVSQLSAASQSGKRLPHLHFSTVRLKYWGRRTLLCDPLQRWNVKLKMKLKKKINLGSALNCAKGCLSTSIY